MLQCVSQKLLEQCQERLLNAVNEVVGCCYFGNALEADITYGSEEYEDQAIKNDGINSYESASKYCKNVGGELTSVHSFEENEFLKEAGTANYYWLGAKSIQEPEQYVWRWRNAYPMLYSNFIHNTFTKTSLCVSINANGSWIPDNCIRKLPVICKSNLLKHFSGNETWLNLERRYEAPKRWIWADNSKFNYAEWNRMKGSGDCLALRTYLHWETKNCSMKLPFICKYTVNKFCKAGWLEYDNYCFLFVRISRPAERQIAENICNIKGGYLASIRNEKEEAFITARLAHLKAGLSYFENIWIGLQCFNKWIWNDDTNYGYQNWASRNGVSSNCSINHPLYAFLNLTDGTWSTTNDPVQQMPYICKYRSI
uniref:C-type lectin domain-containing protein n=1 Tax=Syphacia muris TaxID=451379 RepID=A0A0N5AQ09_9BILA